jgi:hypothetical protein
MRSTYYGLFILGEGDDEETTETPPAAEEEPTEVSKNLVA